MGCLTTESSRRGGRSLVAIATAVAIFGGSISPVFADASDAAVAQSLFDEGKRLMLEKKYADACPKLTESYRLDAAPGTLLNLGVCNEAWGKTATAWTQFKDSVSIAKKDGRAEREKFAREHADAIEPKLSRLTVISLETEPSLEVKIDGSKLGKAAFGIALPIDPGSHTVEATAVGKKLWSRKIEIGAEADKKSIEVPKLETAPIVEVREAPKKSNTAFYVSGGIGAAALIVGGIAGGLAFSKWSTRKSECGIGGKPDDCTKAGVDAESSAKTWANISNVGIGVGIVGIGLATYFALSGSKADKSESVKPTTGAIRVTPDVGPTGGRVTFSVAF